MLRVKNVSKAFKDNQVLKKVDLEVEKGDVVVILGPSGSGKTTFLRCIDFLEKADGGEMEFDDIKTDLNHASAKTIEKIRKKSALSIYGKILSTGTSGSIASPAFAPHE
mgnify:CR=1 FL=1